MPILISIGLLDIKLPRKELFPQTDGRRDGRTDRRRGRQE